jgi:hypothetical protein
MCEILGLIPVPVPQKKKKKEKKKNQKRKWYNHFGSKVDYKVNSSYNTTIPLLGINLSETKLIFTQKVICECFIQNHQELVNGETNCGTLLSNKKEQVMGLHNNIDES